MRILRQTSWRSASAIVLCLRVCLNPIVPVEFLFGQQRGREAGGAKRPLNVADTIEMVRVAGDAHYESVQPPPALAYFSPDGSRFVIVLRKGNLRRNVNDYSMLLVRTAGALSSQRPEVLVKMSTSSNEDAIRQVHWVSRDTIAFLGENQGRPAQVYTFDLKAHKLEQRTHHPSQVLEYRASASGEVRFLAEDNPVARNGNDDVNGTVVVSDQQIDEMLMGKRSAPSSAKMFSQRVGQHEVELSGKELPKEASLPAENPAREDRQVVSGSISVSLEEDMNTPQKLYVTDVISKKKSVLLDLNPQFSELNFAKVELVTWKGTDGKQVLNGGGLLLPTDYLAGQKYPLVIQTHHFQKDLFMIDGPWSSGYAAQALAAKGFVVLEVHHAEGYYDHKPTEARSEMAMYEGAIDYLDGRGLIDRNRVGIFAFSRTVYHVAYTLTHSQYAFGAAILEDGIDGGYFQYVSSPSLAKDYESKYGGSPWSGALPVWMNEAPGFNLEKVKTPIRIMEHGRAGILEQWEWFSGLKLLHKPVDMVVLPNADYGEHLLKKPAERMVSQQGTVDWFCFWLKDEEDPDPAKVEQYGRWRELRKLSNNSAAQSGPAGVN